MPESVLDQLDKSPKDQQVDMKEIQDALKEGFFDKEENIKSLKEELDIGVDKLKESFMNSLTIYKNDLVKKNIQDLSSGEIKILQLYANYKLQENFNIDGKLSSHLTEVMALWNDEYLKHIGLILHIEDKKVKDLLCKTSFRELDEATIMSLTETDIPTFITININEYPLEIQNKLLINIQCLLLEWNGLFPNSTMRQNSGTLLDIKNNSDYQKRVNKSFAAMYADKQKFLDGSVSATDFTKYKQGYDLTKYDGNPFYSAFKQLLSTMSQESGASKNIDLAPLYVSWAKLGQNFLTSFFFKVIENRSEDAGESNGENIRETIYFEFIGYTLKDVITQVDADIDGSGKKTKISIMKEDYYRKYPGQSLSAYQQKIFAGTRYGKSLQSATDRRYSNHFGDKEKQKQYDLDEKLIQEYGKTVTTLEKEVKYWKQKSETATLGGVDKTGIYFQNYTKACEKLTKDGNRAFVAMILQLNLYGLPDNSINALSKGDQTFAKLIKQHYTALQNGVKNQYKGETKLPAPIGTADYMIDYTQQTTEVRTSTRGIMQGNKATSYAGDSERVKKHVDRMIRDTVGAHIEDIMMDVEKHPEKFFIDVAAIVAAGAITGLTGGWGGMLVQAALFTASHTALSGLGQGILEVNEGGNFLEGVGKGSGFLSQVAKPDGTVTWEFNASDVIENKIWEYGTNIILFGPVGKFGHVAERGALTLIEKDAVMKGTESFIAKLGLEQAGAKTLGLLAEAGLFTGFNAVMGSARQGFDAKSRADATEIGNLAAGFVHNIMFIGALKLGNFATSSFQEKIAGKSLTNASKKGQAEVEGLNNEYNIKLKELKDLYQIEPTKIGGEVKFMKNGQEVPDGELYKMSNIKDIQNKIIEAEKNLVNIQVQITTKTQEFTNKPEVKKYNEFIDEYDLRRETLTPESIIDLRIKSAEKVKDVAKIEELKKLKEELQTYQTQYNIILDATVKGTQDMSMPTEKQMDETQTTIDPNIVKKNSLLSPEARIIKAKELPGLKDITQAQEKAILDAHNLPGELFNLSFGEKRAKMEKLLEANFSKEQIKVLMDNGICGNTTEYFLTSTDGSNKELKNVLLEIRTAYDMKRADTYPDPRNFDRVNNYTLDNQQFLEKYIPKDLLKEQDFIDEIIYKYNLEKLYTKYYNSNHSLAHEGKLKLDLSGMSDKYKLKLQEDREIREKIYKDYGAITPNEIQIISKVGISKEELAALISYKGDSYEGLNKILRGKKTLGDKEGFYKNLNSALSKLDNKAGTFLRGIGFGKEDGQTFIQNLIDKYDKNEPRSDEGFQSMSSDVGGVTQGITTGSSIAIKLQIETKSAKDITFLELNKGEEEFMLQPGVKFEVVERPILVENGLVTIKLREVGIDKTELDPAIVEANKNRSKYNSQEIQRLYDEGKKGESLLIKDLKQKMKEGVITPAEYTRQVKEFQSTFPAYGDVQVAKNTETIAKYSYPISQETIDRYIADIGENIQGGGGNAEGVHIIKGTNLVAVIKGEGSYVYELPQKTLMSGLTTTRVPRVVDVFVHEGKTYKIMEKSPGIQIDKLSAQQLSEIPQEHYNNFVKDVKEIENAGLSVDPSKPSNFFYDAETGFHLIDLAVRGDNKRSMFDQVGNFNAKGILDNGKINEAVKNLEHTESSNQIKPDPAIVKANSLNSDKLIIDGKINLEAKNTIEQILREGKVLGEKETLTDEQIRRIYEAHNLPGELYNLNFGETRAKMEKLLEANFSKEQIRVLMDNGICGEISEKGIYAAIESYKSVENITVDNKDITVDNILSSEEYKLFIEGIDDVEVMKKNAEFLYFSENKDAVPVSSKKQDFYNALKDGDNETAKKLYKDAVYTTIKKFDNIGLTVQNNIKLIEYFRTRNYDGVKEMRSKIVEKNEVTKTKDTESQFAKKSVDKETGEETIEYNDVVKNEYSDPNTGERVLLTRKELHEKIIEKFLSEGEPAVGDKELILSGGMPGAGKGSIEKNLVGAHVKVNPDLVKDYLPEYYDADGNKFGAEIVHEESSYISKIVYDRAVEKGLSIFYDSSMKDNSSKNFPKYNKIVNAAYKQGYKIEGRFIYDGGEARYRNTIIRERTMPLDNYSAYSSSYETIEFLSKDPRVSRVEILDNSLNGKKSDSKIVYENQKINMEKSDKDLVKKVEEYSEFLKKL